MDASSVVPLVASMDETKAAQKVLWKVETLVVASVVWLAVWKGSSMAAMLADAKAFSMADRWVGEMVDGSVD